MINFNSPTSSFVRIKLLIWLQLRWNEWKVKCEDCERKFEVLPEIFSNYEIVFCPVCGLHHQVVKEAHSVKVNSIEYA